MTTEKCGDVYFQPCGQINLVCNILCYFNYLKKTCENHPKNKKKPQFSMELTKPHFYVKTKCTYLTKIQNTKKIKIWYIENNFLFSTI